MTRQFRVPAFAALAAVLLGSVPAMAQTADDVGARPHHANYADTGHRKPSSEVQFPAERVRADGGYHRPHHAD